MAMHLGLNTSRFKATESITERNIIPLRTIVSQIHKNTIGVHSENEFKTNEKKVCAKQIPLAWVFPNNNSTRC